MRILAKYDPPCGYTPVDDSARSLCIETETPVKTAALINAAEDLLDSSEKLISLIKGFIHLRKEEIGDYPEITEAINRIKKAGGNV